MNIQASFRTLSLALVIAAVLLLKTASGSALAFTTGEPSNGQYRVAQTQTQSAEELLKQKKREERRKARQEQRRKERQLKRQLERKKAERRKKQQEQLKRQQQKKAADAKRRADRLRKIEAEKRRKAEERKRRRAEQAERRKKAEDRNRRQAEDAKKRRAEDRRKREAAEADKRKKAEERRKREAAERKRKRQEKAKQTDPARTGDEKTTTTEQKASDTKLQRQRVQDGAATSGAARRITLEQQQLLDRQRRLAERRARERKQRMSRTERQRLEQQERRLRRATRERRQLQLERASRTETQIRRERQRRREIRQVLGISDSRRNERRLRQQRRLDRQLAWERQLRRQRRWHRDFHFHRRARIVRRRNDRIIFAGLALAAVGAATGGLYVYYDDDVRFGRRSRNVYVEPLRNGWTRTVAVRRDGVRVVTIRDRRGFIVRRYRVWPDRRVSFIFNNQPSWWHEDVGLYVDVGPVSIGIPLEHYVVEPSYAPPELIYDTVTAPPVEELDRTYTLNQVLVSEGLRNYMPRIDLDTITFASGSAEIPPGQIDKLEAIGVALEQAIKENPEEVYLIEGHTDAVGSAESNLELSDRRAAAVGDLLTDSFDIPPENLVTQGYGEEFLKIKTQGPERRNRRVTVRRVTPLISRDSENVAFDADGNEIIEDDGPGQ